jgi:uncharacterized protein HemY
MPKNPLFRFHMGLLLYEEQDYVKASETFEKALKLGLNPEEATIAKNLMEKAKSQKE